jgi:hypothetical protein
MREYNRRRKKFFSEGETERFLDPYFWGRGGLKILEQEDDRISARRIAEY